MDSDSESTDLMNCTRTKLKERVVVLERENQELKRKNEILRKASAYFIDAERSRRGD